MMPVDTSPLSCGRAVSQRCGSTQSVLKSEALAFWSCFLSRTLRFERRLTFNVASHCIARTWSKRQAIAPALMFNVCKRQATDVLSSMAVTGVPLSAVYVFDKYNQIRLCCAGWWLEKAFSMARC